MGKYIDRAALFNSLTNAKTVAEVFAAIQDAPAADVYEIKHGRWRLARDKQMEYKVCSICAEKMPLNQWRREWESPYCPNCGAQMDLEENDG